MKQNISISIIKTKIGNFLLEFKNETILKFFPTKREVLLSDIFACNIQSYLNNYFLSKEKVIFFKVTPNGTKFQK